MVENESQDPCNQGTAPETNAKKSQSKSYEFLCWSFFVYANSIAFVLNLKTGHVSFNIMRFFMTISHTTS